MSRTKAARTGLFGACVGLVVTLGVPASSATGDDAADERGGVRLIVPHAPGEPADVVSGGSPLASRVAVRSAQSEQANAADRRFARHMIPHHYQAILMSRMAPDRAADKRIRRLAARIRTEQNVEIDGMQGWQAGEGLPVTDARHAYHHMLHDHDMIEHMGMATRREMEALRSSRRRAFDRKFVALMIPHHRGAIRMAEEVAGSGNDVFLRQQATDMIASQSRQIYDMRRIRDSW